MNPSFEIKADIPKNRLYITLKGFFSDDLMKQAADKTIEEAHKLNPGFDTINDISQFKPASAVGLQHIQRAQRAIQEHGVKRVVRIVDMKNMTTKMQFKRVGNEVYDSVEMNDTATSMAEAELFLDSHK